MLMRRSHVVPYASFATACQPCTKMAKVIPPMLVDFAETCKQDNKETDTEAR